VYNKQCCYVLTGNLLECVRFIARLERAPTLLTVEGVQKTKLCHVSLFSPKRNARARIHRCKIKVMFTLEQATKAQRGSRVIALLFL